MELQHEGFTLNDEKAIREAFFKDLFDLLGYGFQVLDLDVLKLYPDSPNVTQLVIPFSEHEVSSVVSNLASNKACGSDGLPNEFLKEFWPSLKGNIMKIVHDFAESRLDLTEVNRANVIFIPKNDSATRTKDFRPISIINLIPKLISKLLANRLAKVLPDLISMEQTAFMRGRYIAENLLSTRETLQYLSSHGYQAIFAKVDFAKAFDSINWTFLLKVLHGKGFPKKWIIWVTNILSSSSSRIVMNGTCSDYFSHKRGLRQGDPLSPLLFNIAVDVLQRMVANMNSISSSRLSPRIHNPISALQYADDTAFIIKADDETVVNFKLLLRLFSKVSGLRVNFAKSAIVPFNLDQHQILRFQAITGCAVTELPMVYLGMPLTVKKPSRACYMSLVENMQKKLQG